MQYCKSHVNSLVKQGSAMVTYIHVHIIPRMRLVLVDDVKSAIKTESCICPELQVPSRWLLA